MSCSQRKRVTRTPQGRRYNITSADGTAAEAADRAARNVKWNQRKVVARPMVVINLKTRAGLTRRPIARPRWPGHTLLTAVVGVIATAGVLAGCGTAAAPGAAGTGSHPAAAKATLTIKVINRADGKVSHWTLRCDPVGGTTPDPAAACKTLSGTKNALSPLRHHIMCPMMLVSGEQIIVDGTWHGKKVHRVIIDGGCDLSIFNNLVKTFGAKIFN